MEDLNWHLYKLPGEHYRDSFWLYWVSGEGRERLVTSAYGTDAVPFPDPVDLGSVVNFIFSIPAKAGIQNRNPNCGSHVHPASIEFRTMA